MVSAHKLTGGNAEAPPPSSCGRGSRASCRRDNGEDSGAQHCEANQPNSRQALRDNTKASAAAALPEAEGKTTKGEGGEKSPLQSHNHFVRCTEDTEAVHSQSSGGTRLANRS